MYRNILDNKLKIPVSEVLILLRRITMVGHLVGWLGKVEVT